MMHGCQHVLLVAGILVEDSFLHNHIAFKNVSAIFGHVLCPHACGADNNIVFLDTHLQKGSSNLSAKLY